MRRHAVFGLIAVFAASGATAQQSPPQAETPPSSSSTAPKAVVAMEEPLPGDYWTYEIRDEITGTISATRNNVVTEVTPTLLKMGSWMATVPVGTVPVGTVPVRLTVMTRPVPGLVTARDTP